MKNNHRKFKPSPFYALATLLFVLPFAARISAATIWLDDLELGATSQGWGEPHKNQSVDGHGLNIGGSSFARGLGTHAESILYINLNNAAQTFSASFGLNSRVPSPRPTFKFRGLGAGKILWKTGVINAVSGHKLSP